MNPPPPSPQDPFQQPPPPPGATPPPPPGGPGGAALPPPGAGGTPPAGGGPGGGDQAAGDGGGAGGGGSNKRLLAILGAIVIVTAGIVVATQMLGDDDDPDCSAGEGNGCTDPNPDESVAADTEGAAEAAKAAVEAASDGDCDAAAEYATDGAQEFVTTLCEAAPSGFEVGEAKVVKDVPTVVEVDVGGYWLRFVMVHAVDDEWLIDGPAEPIDLPGMPDVSMPDVSVLTDDTDDPDDTGGSGEADTDGAVAAAEAALEDVAAGDCAAVAEATTDNFRSEAREELCGDAPDDLEILGAELLDEDPVVVGVDYKSSGATGQLPLEMVYEDGEWLIAGPGIPPTETDATGGPATGGGDPEDAVTVAEQVVRQVIAGECDTVDRYATPEFQRQSIAVCQAAPSGMRIIDASVEETEPEVLVDVRGALDDDTFSITLTMEYDGDEWLVADVELPD